MLQLAALLDVDARHVDVDVGPDELGRVRVLHEVAVAGADQATRRSCGEGHDAGPRIDEKADDGEDGAGDDEEGVAGVGEQLLHDCLVGCLPVLVRDHLAEGKARATQ